ncbi:MAG TPA: stalk domain-containing protein [Symbiobacteriaceae bacterium]|nr:stalk domain-containing protein [Symbiobacteriaceae bacterium]
MRKRSWLLTLAGLPLLVSGLLPVPAASAAAPVQVILDGRTLALDPAPAIVGERTLVPMRGLLEAMGATVTWEAETQTVKASKNDRYVQLRIGRRLACLSTACTSAASLDVPAQIIGDRTFVPARFVSQAMGARVTWDNERRAVIIETNKAPDYQFSSVTIPSLQPGQSITGPTELRAAGGTGAYVQFYLIDPATGAGRIIAAGADTQAAYSFTPDPTVKGNRLVVAAVRGTDGVTRYSDPVAVTMAPSLQVRVTGIANAGVITGPIELGNDVNFVAVSAVIQVLDAMNSVETIGTVGPGDKLTWYPQIGHNGDRWIRAVATDLYGNTYESPLVAVRVESGYRQMVPGINEGTVLTGPVTLKPSANYGVEAIKYLLDEQILGWGYEYKWNFGQELNGAHTLRVEILGKDGQVHNAGPYNITINVQPYVRFNGIGPNQVVTGQTALKLTSNVTLSTVEYYLGDAAGGAGQVIGQGQSFNWTPTAAQAGDRTIWAVAWDNNGNRWTTDKVKFRVFLGKVYGPQPLGTKDEFKALAIKLAVPSYRDTGMSAALQAAQSFLETGYGQSVPVDKYKGQPSYNLFGIKGTGPAGSIITNTWEEYNGVAYRVDDYFRAYNTPEESWKDHKAFLLERARYAPYRAVMSNPVMGAWALRRTGYATDSQYPYKLIRIMKENDLFKLDDFEF